MIDYKITHQAAEAIQEETIGETGYLVPITRWEVFIEAEALIGGIRTIISATRKRNTLNAARGEAIREIERGLNESGLQ